MKIKKIFSFVMSAVMLSTSINLTQVSAGQVLYGDYVLISNTSLDPNVKEPTGVIEFDDLGVYTTQQLNANAYKGMVACSPTTVYDGSGSMENVSAQTGNTKTYSVGDKSKFKYTDEITCVGVGSHCYVWMDNDLYEAYGDTNRQTAVNAAIKTFDEYSYEKYLKEYNYDKYIRYYDNSDKLSIVFVNESTSASGYFASSPTETAIYIPRTADSVKTQTADEIKRYIYSEGVLYAHEAQHAMAHSQGRIYGLWINEGLSVSIMSNRDDWIRGFQNNSNIAGGAPVICNSNDDHDSVYVLSHLFLRYLNVQANGGRYLHSDNVSTSSDIAAYQKFYSYFYTTNVPEGLTENSRDIYIIEYLMQDYHKQDNQLFANSDGSCWDFNDALRNFRLAVMMQNDSGIYSYGTPGISELLPYYPVYSGESGKSVSIPGTGAIIVKTQNGRFDVPEVHGSHMEYVSFNCNKSLNDGTNILKTPTKDFYVTGDKYTADGLTIGQTNSGVNSVYTNIAQLNSVGLYVCMLDENHTNETFTLVTDGMTMNVPYPTNERENFMVFLCYSKPTDFNSFLNTPKDFLYRLTVAEKDEDELTVPVTDSDGYYKIFNKAQFEWFGANCSINNSIKAKLMADIVLNTGDIPALAKSGNTASLSNWEPNYFVGELDGQGHYISGLYSSGTSYRGLFFGLYGNASVHDLGIVNSYIESTDNRAGVFAASMNSSTTSITNCYTDAWVKSSYSCGGIINYGYGAVKNCIFVGTLDSGTYYRYPVGEKLNPENTYYISSCGHNMTDGQGTALTGASFGSGEAAYLLNTKGDDVWFQNIDNGKTADGYPVLDSSHGTVYKVTNGYSNDPNAVLETTTETTTTETTTETTTIAYVNGFGSDGSYQPAELKNGWYEIGNAGQLYWFQNKSAKSDTTIKGKLINDITVNESDVVSLAKAGNTSELRKWEPLAGTAKFNGEFDGQGYTISGLYSENSYSFTGFSGRTLGTIENLGIINSYFYTDLSGAGRAGAIAGYLGDSGIIENCWSNAYVGSVFSSGGITQMTTGTVRNCYYTGEGAKYGIGVINSRATSENNFFMSGTDGTGCIQASKEQFASGEVAYKINQAAGKTIYYQNIDNGKTKDSAPVLDSAHGVVYYKDGKYTNINSSVETSTETTTHQQTTNSDGYDENGLDANENYQPAVYKNGAYEIGNMGQLYWYANYINKQNGSKDGRLVADIVVNSGKIVSTSQNVRKWTPIGNATGHTEGVFYKNTFDGQGHYISGLYCDEQFFAGLFGCLSGGTVKNVGVINSYFTASKGAGAIAGGGSDLTTGGTVSGCYSAYNVMYAQDNAGGIVGGAWKGTTIKDCFCAHCGLTAYNTSISDAFTGAMAGYIAINDKASTSGGKYTGIETNGGNGSFYGDTSSKEYYKGDSNLDGKTDILDAISAQKISFEYKNFASYTTDLDDDQKITKADAGTILKNIAA